MSLDTANILGLNYIYVIVVQSINSGKSKLIKKAYVNIKDAEEAASYYEFNTKHDAYTTIVKLEVK